MNRCFVLVSGLVLALALHGCLDDPKAANKENFKKAIQGYFDTLGSECWKSAYLDKVNTEQGYTVDDPLTKLSVGRDLDELSEAGLLVSDVTIVKNKGLRAKMGMKESEISNYKMSEIGKSAYEEGQGFCYGKKEVVDVVQFSEPSSFGPLTVSEVKFTYKIVEQPEWVDNLKDNSVRLAQISNSSIYPFEKKDGLVLTNDGWVHRRLYNR